MNLQSTNLNVNHLSHMYLVPLMLWLADLNNYRFISVIPAVAKFFEKVIYDQLCNYLNVNDLLTRA